MRGKILILGATQVVMPRHFASRAVSLPASLAYTFPISSCLDRGVAAARAVHQRSISHSPSLWRVERDELLIQVTASSENVFTQIFVEAGVAFLEAWTARGITLIIDLVLEPFLDAHVANRVSARLSNPALGHLRGNKRILGHLLHAYHTLAHESPKRRGEFYLRRRNRNLR